MVYKSDTVIVNGGVNSATVVRLHIPAFKKNRVERTGSHIVYVAVVIQQVVMTVFSTGILGCQNECK